MLLCCFQLLLVRFVCHFQSYAHFRIYISATILHEQHVTSPKRQSFVPFADKIKRGRRFPSAMRAKRAISTLLPRRC